MGKDDGAAHLLVRMTGVNAETNMEFEAFVKLCRRALFGDGYGLFDGVLLCEIDFFKQRLVTFSFFRHYVFLLVVVVGSGKTSSH